MSRPQKIPLRPLTAAERTTLQQVARILREWQRFPDRARDGTATWSLTTLQRALRHAPDGLPQVSTATIRRVLHEAGLRWQRNRTWCETGVVQAQPVTRTTNAVLHPWLMHEFTAILATLPPPDPQDAARQAAAWEWRERPLWDLATLPPVRLLLIWDNLASHHTPELLNWLVTRGVWPLFTPLGGAWLNLAESLQRIVVTRALAGHHAASLAELMHWLEAAVAGWNAEPTPFVWGGERALRRQRARVWRHALGGSGVTLRPLPRPRHPPYQLPPPNGHTHAT